MPRVAVTTDVDRAHGMAAELVAAGLRPVMLPCTGLRLGRHDDQARIRAAAEDADLLILTSSRPIDILWPDGPLPETPIAAVGPATATRVAERGGLVSMTGSGNALRFAQALAERVEGLSLAFPHSAATDPRAIVTLADAARSLVAVPIYATVPCPPPSDAVDAAVFVSPAAVHGWALARTFDGIAVGSLGVGTRGALERFGRSPDIAVSSSSYDELAGALARYLA